MKPHHLRRSIGIALLALSLVGAISLTMKEYPLALFGERSTGIVTKVEKITVSSGSNGYIKNGQHKGIKYGSEQTYMDLDFTTKEGRPMQVKTLATFHTEAKAGDQHPMIYLPWKPETAKIYSAKQLWMPMCVGTIFTIVCLWGGLRLLRQKASSTGGNV